MRSIPRRYYQTADLPASLREVASLCGEEAAWRLLEAYPGQKIYVPLPCLIHPLIDLLGQRAAWDLFYYFGGAPLQVPLGAHAHRAARARQMKDWRRAGWQINAIVSASGLCRRTVMYYLAE